MMETLPEQFEHRPDCEGAEIDTHCLGCAMAEQNRADATAEMLRRMLFDFGDFDTDEDRLAEFRRLRKEARKLVHNAKVSGPEAALSPEGRARLPGCAPAHNGE